MSQQPTESKKRTEMIMVLRRIAEELGTTSVSYLEFRHRSAINWPKIKRLFGTYNGLVAAAGLVPKAHGIAPLYSEKDFIAEIARVLRLPGSKLTTTFFVQHSQMSIWTCITRFGGWFKALKATAEKLDPVQDRDLISRIRTYTVRKVARFRGAEPPPGSTLPLRPSGGEKNLVLPAAESQLPPADGNLYGDFIRFRNLEHAPVNEQGVIFLFGMICGDLGYVVEILKPGFPDCEAKREVRPGVWRRVRIEFEFRSRTFRTHRHDSSQCDVIVCWENNWPNCPIEVQELKSVLRRLSPRAEGP